MEIGVGMLSQSITFPQDIKDSILTKARQIKIEDEKSKKN